MVSKVWTGSKETWRVMGVMDGWHSGVGTAKQFNLWKRSVGLIKCVYVDGPNEIGPKLNLRHLVHLMMYDGLVTFVEGGTAVVQMTDGPGKAIGKGLGVIGIGLGLK